MMLSEFAVMVLPTETDDAVSWPALRTDAEIVAVIVPLAPVIAVAEIEPAAVM